MGGRHCDCEIGRAYQSNNLHEAPKGEEDSEEHVCGGMIPCLRDGELMRSSRPGAGGVCDDEKEHSTIAHARID